MKKNVIINTLILSWLKMIAIIDNKGQLFTKINKYIVKKYISNKKPQ